MVNLEWNRRDSYLSAPNESLDSLVGEFPVSMISSLNRGGFWTNFDLLGRARIARLFVDFIYIYSAPGDSWLSANFLMQYCFDLRESWNDEESSTCLVRLLFVNSLLEWTLTFWKYLDETLLSFEGICFAVKLLSLYFSSIAVPAMCSFSSFNTVLPALWLSLVQFILPPCSCGLKQELFKVRTVVTSSRCKVDRWP